ncbi:MAG: helix-turn-helix domain-containing protein [Clostridia bacterium]|nr:helix-turn-helix domain-containing protein [Clostridia bacterium]MBQ8827875.1 helix-turn-helix domain-containing protein [Clostridia bacterium]
MEYNTKEIGRIIAQKRREKGLTLDEVGARVGVTKSTIQRYEAGLIGTPKQAVLESIARTLSIEPSILTGKKTSVPANAELYYPNEQKIAVPILGKVSAGAGAYADSNNILGYIMEERSRLTASEDYAYLLVQGDSMYPEFKDGDKVLIQCTPSAESGDYAVVMVDDDNGVVKKIEIGTDYITLHSVNPMYPPRKFEGKDMLRIRIFGIVKGLRRSY